jgi:hypothetical protein
VWVFLFSRCLTSFFFTFSGDTQGVCVRYHKEIMKKNKNLSCALCVGRALVWRHYQNRGTWGDSRVQVAFGNALPSTEGFTWQNALPAPGWKNMHYKVIPRYIAKFLAGHYVGQHSFILGNAPLLRCYSTHKAVTKKILEYRLPSKTFPPKKVGSFENHVIFSFFSMIPVKS